MYINVVLMVNVISITFMRVFDLDTWRVINTFNVIFYINVTSIVLSIKITFS